MLSEVINAVAKAKQDLPEIARHNPDEAGTKNSLIHPILRSLGWAVSNLNRVTPEFRVGNYMKHKVDYALIDAGGAPRAFVEAKRFRDPLSGEDQLFDYVSTYLGKETQAADDLACIVFTNGRKWRFYPVNVPGKKPYYDDWDLTVDLAKEDTEQCAKSLSLLLSESRICDGRAQQQLTAEFKEQRIAQKWQRMITEPDKAQLRWLRKQLKPNDFKITDEEVARAIRHPMSEPASIPPLPPAPPPEDTDRRGKKSKPSLRVTVGSEEFDSARFRYLNRMLPKVLKAIMELENISGHRLVQTCLEAKIAGSNSRAWVVSADMLAELRNSPNPGARTSAHSSKPIDERADYFVLTNHSTGQHARKLEKLGRALGLGSALKAEVIQGS